MFINSINGKKKIAKVSRNTECESIFNVSYGIEFTLM